MADDYRVNPQPWMREAIAVCGDDLMQQIVADNRNRAPVGGSVLPTVKILGAGAVTTGDDGAAHRSYQPTEDDRSGWREPDPLRPPPGINLIDEMVAAQDERDLIERAKQMAAAKHARALAEAEAMGLSHADWSRMSEADLKARKEQQEKKLKGQK